MKTIVISDLHLGLDDRISEDVTNRPKLVDFIDKIRSEKMADELVIAGDFLDQWFYPGSVDLPRDSREFYLACAKNNQAVVDALVRLIESGIPVVYVPGNHDMTMGHEVLAEIVPGVRQARDVPGLGRYRTGVRGEVVVEHSHRYEIMCAPDTVTNADLVEYGCPMLPAGYKDFTGYDRPKIFANSGTWVDDNGDDPNNTATFVLIESTHEGDVVQVLKCLGDGKVEDIVPVENDHIRRA